MGNVGRWRGELSAHVSHEVVPVQAAVLYATCEHSGKRSGAEMMCLYSRVQRSIFVTLSYKLSILSASVASRYTRQPTTSLCPRREESECSHGTHAYLDNPIQSSPIQQCTRMPASSSSTPRLPITLIVVVLSCRRTIL
jgi:hypothetical protein